MKTYKTGDSICFKNLDDEREFGKVRFELARAEEGVFGYEVETEAGYYVAVRLDQIVDFEEIALAAGAALDRYHAEHSRKADLLSELLGRLGYYADHGGHIEYRNEYSQNIEQVPVLTLVSEFVTRRDAK